MVNNDGEIHQVPLQRDRAMADGHGHCQSPLRDHLVAKLQRSLKTRVIELFLGSNFDIVILKMPPATMDNIFEGLPFGPEIVCCCDLEDFTRITELTWEEAVWYTEKTLTICVVRATSMWCSRGRLKSSPSSRVLRRVMDGPYINPEDHQER